MKKDVLDFQIDVYAAGDQAANKVALMIPGLLDSKDYPHMRAHVEHLATRGYYALAIDLPGTWGSSGTIKDYTITNCLKVIDAIITSFDKPTLLVGHSNGGRLAMHAAKRNAMVEAVISVMSPYVLYRGDEDTEDMRHWRETGVKISDRDMPGNREQQKRFELPFSFIEDSTRYNLEDDLPLVTIPKLFVAGVRDSIISVDEVEKAYDAAADPKDFFVIDSGHNYRKVPEAIKLLNARIDEFIESIVV